MSPASLPLILLMLWPQDAAASLQCRPGREFWDSARQLCRDCSRCAPPDVVLRPCGVHWDALCGPVADLDIDWSWIDGRRREPDRLEIALLEDAPRTDEALPPSDASEDVDGPAGPGRKRKHKKHSADDRGKQRARKRKHKKRRHDRRNPAESDDVSARRPEAASQVRSSLEPPAEVADDAPLPRSAAREPEAFSAVETLVWDGQAFALALAVFACLFFFLVAAVYSVYQARHWRRLNNNFQADVEELSAQLSLVATGCAVVDQVSTPDSSPTSGDTCGKKQCSYLEQLLARRQQQRKQANVYIERQSSVRGPTEASATASMKE